MPTTSLPAPGGLSHVEGRLPAGYFFRDDLRALDLRFLDDFLRGTLAPARRASERPIAIACLRLVTFLPERPLLRVPRFRLRMELSTFRDAFLLYLATMLLQ
jgi:hypothetical protein